MHQHFPMTLGSVHVPRTKPAASEATPAENAQSTGRENIKCPSTWSAWRLCAGDGDACREHAGLAQAAAAGWATAAAAPPKDGARPCASRRASQSLSELDAVSAAQGASEAGAEGAEGPEASTGGCEPTEAAWRARETRERRSWGGGTGAALGGQARDQSRLRESNRTTQARGGAGTATRCTFGQRRRGTGASACPRGSRREESRTATETLRPRGHARGTTKGAADAALTAGAEGEPASGGAAGATRTSGGP